MRVHARARECNLFTRKFFLALKNKSSGGCGKFRRANARANGHRAKVQSHERVEIHLMRYHLHPSREGKERDREIGCTYAHCWIGCVWVFFSAAFLHQVFQRASFIFRVTGILRPRSICFPRGVTWNKNGEPHSHLHTLSHATPKKPCETEVRRETESTRRRLLLSFFFFFFRACVRVVRVGKREISFRFPSFTWIESFVFFFFVFRCRCFVFSLSLSLLSSATSEQRCKKENDRVVVVVVVVDDDDEHFF